MPLILARRVAQLAVEVGAGHQAKVAVCVKPAATGQRIAVAIDDFTRVAVRAPLTKVGVENNVAVAVGVAPSRVDVGVEVLTDVAVSAALSTRVAVDNAVKVDVAATTRGADVAVDVDTRVQVKTLLASVVVNPRTHVDATIRPGSLDLTLGTGAHVELGIGKHHVVFDFGRDVKLHVALPAHLFDNRILRLSPPR